MRRLLIALVAVVALAGGCGGDDSDGVDVFAAASLTAVFNDLESDASFTFAGSQSLVRQIHEGADADVFASADEKTMQTLVDAGLVETPQVFATNRLVIAVAPGNPKGIRGLADLQRDGVVLVLADASVPAGNYARQAFAKAGLPEPEPASNELDVNATLAKVAAGEADAAVVYVTDVTAAGNTVEAVTIPAEHNVVAVYPIAVVKATADKRAAQDFVDEVLGSNGQQTLAEHGFLPPG